MGKESGEQTKTRAAQDPEIKAMGAIARVMSTLNESERQGVVGWFVRKYGAAAKPFTATGFAGFSDANLAREK
jgi:hypothetical protein